MKKILLYSLILVALIPNLSKAADDKYKLLEPLPCLEGSTNCTPNTIQKEISLGDYIGYIFKFAIALAAFLAVIMIIKGGFEYMMSETPFGKGNGRTTITNAVMGLVMVLASYLILLTVDPRLVEINTSIQPIKVDTSSVKNFEDALSNDLSKLSAENQLILNDSIAAIKDKQKRIDYLASLGDEIGTEERVELERLKSEISSTKIQISSITAQDVGIKEFRTVIDNVYNPNTTNVFSSDPGSLGTLAPYLARTVPNVLVNGKYPTNSENIIQNEYNLEINSVLSKDPQLAQTLAKQRDFYINAAKDEVDLHNKIVSNGIPMSTGTQGPGPKINNDEYLKTLSLKYQANIKNAQNAADAGLPTTQYNQIMQARIDRIQTALTKK